MASLSNASNTPLSTRYNDVPPSGTRLPSGGCNYTNLSLGANAAKCGCRRFWDRTLDDSSDGGRKTGFCMCEHHACYHDDFPRNEPVAAPVGAATPHQSPRIQELSHGQEDALDVLLQSTRSPQGGAIPDSIQWSRYLNASASGLPPIPSQCLLPSDNGSVLSASQSGYYKPFGGRGLDTLKQVVNTVEPAPAQYNTSGRRMQIYEDRHGVQHLQSLTDAATPSVRASQDVEAHGSNRAASAALDSNMGIGPASQQSRPRSASKPNVSQGLRDNSQIDSETGNLNKQLVLHVQPLREPNDMPERFENHEQRLEQLENVSFTHPGIEQLQESHEQMEIRVGELEHRITDLETAQAAQDASSVGTRPSIEGSFESHVSHTSAIVPHIDLSRVEILEAQVAELQAIVPPTYSRPWEVEVVFLPFGSRLMGIWSTSASMSQASRLGSTGPDERTQTQLSLTQTRQNSHYRSLAWESSATDFADENISWLMAKACGVGSRVDRRLRSRGLVRTIQICGPDARDIQAAMLKAFGDLPEILAEDPYSSQDENMGEIPKVLRKYIGLQAPWIPVRKLHKDTCLRFLGPSEMLTPALWTVPFLSSSVAMRHSGTRRLYVTQRDSYIQHHGGSLADWTWQKLRQLPRVYDGPSDINHTPEADAWEECWTYDARLDPPPTPQTSFHSSFHSQISQLSIESPLQSPDFPDDGVNVEPVSPSDHFSSGPASPTISTPKTSLPPAIPMSPLRQRNPFRPVQRRTISMSSAIPVRGETSSQGATQSFKRRIPSFSRETQSSPTLQSHTLVNTNASTSQPLRSLEITVKRRRISRSPSRPRNTPRWSMGSPSPFPVLEADAERGTTPFAYATPHSNVAYAPRSAGVEVDVFEDEDDDADYFDGGRNDHPSAEESSTDESDSEDEGYERNALSDYDYDDDHALDPGSENEWGSVDEERLDDGYAGFVNQSFSDYRYEQGYEQDRQIDAESNPESTTSDNVSESPSEYPSTQPHPPVQIRPPPSKGTGLPSNAQIAQTATVQTVTAQTATKRTGLYERRQKKEMGFTIHVDEQEAQDA